jgi:hypothetical protein
MRMSKRRSLRRSLAVLILLLILLGAGWTGLWYFVAGRLAADVTAWEQQERAEGWTITHGTPRRAGWPMAAGITLPGVSVSGGVRYLPGGVAWQAGSVTLALDIRHPDALFIGVEGRQSLAVAGGPAVPFQATKFIGRMALRAGDRPGLIQLHATGLLAALKRADGTPEPLSIADLAAAVRADGTADAQSEALVAAARMTDVALPPNLVPGFARTLQTAAFDLALSGPVPPGGTAAAWQKAGGSLGLRLLHVVDGRLMLDGEGRFQLDASHRPAGSMTLTVAGLDETLDRLARNGVLSRQAVIAITAMLGLMMRPPEPQLLRAPLSLRAGLVSLGAIPVLRLPL